LGNSPGKRRIAEGMVALPGIEPGFEDRESDDLTNAINKLEPAVTNLYTALTTQPKSHLLNDVARFRKCGGNSFRNVARLVLDRPPKPGSDVCLCDMDVVAGGHGGRTGTHQPGEGETVHTRLMLSAHPDLLGALRGASSNSEDCIIKVVYHPQRIWALKTQTLSDFPCSHFPSSLIEEPFVIPLADFLACFLV
jgi:hypothetical protein